MEWVFIVGVVVAGPIVLVIMAKGFGGFLNNVQGIGSSMYRTEDQGLLNRLLRTNTAVSPNRHAARRTSRIQSSAVRSPPHAGRRRQLRGFTEGEAVAGAYDDRVCCLTKLSAVDGGIPISCRGLALASPES